MLLIPVIHYKKAVFSSKQYQLLQKNIIWYMVYGNKRETKFIPIKKWTLSDFVVFM